MRSFETRIQGAELLCSPSTETLWTLERGGAGRERENVGRLRLPFWSLVSHNITEKMEGAAPGAR